MTMPVILWFRPELKRWMTGTVEEALALQRPTTNDMLHIVARGAKEDGVLTQ